MKSIFKDKNRKRADIILVVLASQFIDTEVEKLEDDTWEIRVHDWDVGEAEAHIRRYDRENRPLIRQLKKLSGSTFFSPAILVIMAILCFVHWFCIKTGSHDQAVFRFGASAYFLRQGEAFRAITALFLHSDFRHLMGNMAGLLVLGSPLVRMTGYGSGPFILLCAGTTGNLIAGGLGRDLRISIGASTAVMAAAGLLAAGKMISARREAQGNRGSALKPLAPMAAAATLVAMLSHGENTDVSAHFFGFGSGLGLGLLFFPFFSVFSGRMIERICLALTLVITLTALVQGI